MVSHLWYVYLLECGDGSLYTGVTTDLARRMQVHARGTGSKYVARRGFKQLLASHACVSRSEACQYEYAIKQLPKHQKLVWFEQRRKV